MKREILLAQLKAFQTYLKNHIEDVKARPQIKLDEEGELPVDEHNANSGENEHIQSRYEKLKAELEQQYFEIFHRSLENSFNEGVRGLQFMYREIEFALDTIVNLDAASSNQPANPRANNQPFTTDEVQIINNQLDDLQTKLLETINREKSSSESAAPYIESVKSEINDLKAEVANPTLGRKDWKNHLINTMITLTFTLSFSQEARNIISICSQNLFIYLQQHIFLLKP